MTPKRLRTLVRKQAEAELFDVESAPSRARSESVHRLQIGLSGLAAMVLLVGLANIIQDRARVAESMSVPEAAPTTEPSSQPVQSDPLADAGLVPDLPVEPSATPSPAPAGQGPKTGDVPDPRR